VSIRNVLCAVLLVGGLLVEGGLAEEAVVETAGTSSSSNPADAKGTSKAVMVTPQPQVVREASRRILPFSRIAIAIDGGTLGLGGQIATPLMRRLNLRGSVDLFNFGYGLAEDGANYAGALHLKNGAVSVDYFPFRSGFHISPGLMIFKSRVAASLAVPGGNTFSMGDNSFTSDPSDPVTGTGAVQFTRTVMPSLTFGFSNMIAREGRHWSVPFEFGAAYTGHYSAQINLLGTACSQGSCVPTSDPTIQTSVTQQQNTLNESMKHYQIYPILRTGIAYRF
jgi:hypothetical protein